MLSKLLCAGLMLSVTLLQAAPQQFVLVDQQGLPLADAVVELLDPNHKPQLQQTAKVAQQDLIFRPFVSAAPIGSAFEFPNLDVSRQHVD